MANPHFVEFISLLHAHDVRYLVVGAHALGLHARPRATKDIDILVEPTRANAGRVMAAIHDFFGGASLSYTISDLTNPDMVLQMGVQPDRIDILPDPSE